MKKLIYLTLIVLMSSLTVSCFFSTDYQGYIEGRFRYLTVPFGGTLQQLNVERGQTVNPGTLLFTLDPKPERDSTQQIEAELASALASRDSAKAAVRLATITYNRQVTLLKKQATQAENVDTAKTNLEQTQANLQKSIHDIESLRASLARAKWSQAQKTVYAPVSSTVFDTYFLPGEYVSPQQAVLSLLAPEDIKIIFFVPEKERAKIKLAQEIKVNCDNCEKNITAKVSFISPQAEFTPPVIYSNETRAKLVYRIEAKITADKILLYPGQPVWVSIPS